MPLKFSTGCRNDMMKPGGESFGDMYNDCVVGLFGGGAQPADADADESGFTLLGLVTQNSGAFTPGQPDNGLSWVLDSDGKVVKNPAEIWSCVILADGLVQFARVYDNAKITGASAVARRFDGTVAASGATFIMPNPNVLTGETRTIDVGSVQFPA